jgi:thiamine pyrophosphokinase
MTRKTFIFANGVLRDAKIVIKLIQPDDFIIAADGGGTHLASVNMIPDVVIGDMDSISPDLLARFEKSGSQIQRFPVEKDETDLELAIRLALQKKASEKLVIIAGLGGRLDQTLGNLGLLSMPELNLLDVHFEDGVEEAWFANAGKTMVTGQPGDVVSLIPWGGAVSGITTSGLRYPLMNETLFPEKTRGISNELTLPEARVMFKSGRLLCIHSRS